MTKTATKFKYFSPKEGKIVEEFGKPYKFKSELLQKLPFSFWISKREDGWHLTEERTGREFHAFGLNKNMIEPTFEEKIKRVGFRKFVKTVKSFKDYEDEYEEHLANVEENKRRKVLWQRLSKIMGFTVPLDGVVTAFGGTLCIDVVRLDARLQTPDGISLAQQIENKFGKEARNLADQLT